MVPGIAYGGIKNSGIGKESSLEAMLETYTWSKTNILNYRSS
jgi:acyl-CoA reductase-like NAD-dependent aldehyde dehydrogenase